MLVVIVSASRSLSRIMKTTDAIVGGIILLLPVVFTVLIGYAMHWRVLGRHFIPVLGVAIPFIALGLYSLWQSGRAWKATVALSCVAMLALSSFSLRSYDRHLKEDYRTASAIAVDALSKGEIVWWSAGPFGAEFYGLPIRRPPFDKERWSDLSAYSDYEAIFVKNVSKEFLDAVPSPDLVMLSRPDGRDRQRTLVNFLEKNRYQKSEVVPGFTVWRKTAS